jgi:hypothetical protein
VEKMRIVKNMNKSENFPSFLHQITTQPKICIALHFYTRLNKNLEMYRKLLNRYFKNTSVLLVLKVSKLSFFIK